MSADLLRAFVAVEIEAEMRGRIVAVMRDLKGRLADARWAPEAQLHLTLRFLGDVSRQTVEALKPPLLRAACECPALEVTVQGLGTFPDRGSPRVLWLGMQVPEALLHLQATVEAVVAALGLPREQRPFRPHLTLARWRGPARRPELPEVGLGPTRLSRLILFRSELEPRGAVHTPLATFELGSRP
jgi:2'-5' RNA ligase